MKIFYSFFFLIVAFRSFAQDTHYWTQEFGPHSTLMAGSLVAGAEDISMLFYNPGGHRQYKNGGNNHKCQLVSHRKYKDHQCFGTAGRF